MAEQFTPASFKGMTKQQKFERAAAEAGVPVSALDGIWNRESSRGQNPAAYQPNPASSAFGEFQQLDGTVKGLAKNYGVTIDRSKFDDALWGAAMQLKENMQAFKGDLNLAVAAYKAGPAQARGADGQQYAAKVLGTKYVPQDGDEVYAAGPNNNAQMMQLMFPPSLTANALADVAPRDLRNAVAQAPKEYTPKFVESAATTAAGLALDKGVSLEGASVVKGAVKAGDLPGQMDLATAAQPNLSMSYDRQAAGAEFGYNSDVAQQKLRNDTSAWDAAKDSFVQNNVVARLSKLMGEQQDRHDGWDGTWALTAQHDEDLRKAGYTEREMEQLRDASSEANLQQRKDDIAAQRDEQFTLAQHGVAGFVGGIVGGVADPVGLLITGGAGAVVSSAVRGGVAARIAASGITGAVSNVAITGALEAAGSNITSHDYLMAGLTGASLGLLGHGAMEGLTGSMNSLRRGMAEAKVELHEQAARELGPSATTEEIATRASELDQQRWAQREEMRAAITLSEVPDTHRLMPSDEAQPTLIQEVRSDGATVGDEVIQRYGLDSIVSDAERNLTAETIARAERNQAARPVDVKRLGKIVASLPEGIRTQIETVGMTLARSENPVAHYVSSTLMESAAGTTERVRTASITKTQMENISREQFAEYTALQNEYRQTHGRMSMFDEAIHGTHRREFDRLVQDEIYMRRGTDVADDAARNVPPLVKQGADALERAYQQQLNWLRRVDAIGTQHLPESARGYMPQRMDENMLMTASVAEQRELTRELARQLATFNTGIDAAMAGRLAREYVEHTRARAAGVVEQDIQNVRQLSAPDNLMDLLDTLAVSDRDIARLRDRFIRGGASFTKQRYEFDLSAPVGNRRLADYFVSDQAALFSRYMQRATGEVALAQYGVHGRQGIQLTRDAMVRAANTPARVASLPHDLAAYDAFMRDMMGMPQTARVPGQQAMRNLRMLASMNMLGGMGFTQAAETINIATHLGVRAMLGSVPIVRDMLKDVRLMKGAKLFEQIELIGGRHDAAERFHFPYELPGDELRVYGHDTPGLFTRGLQGASRTFSVITGHRAVHNWQMKMATEQIASKVLRAANGDKKLSKLVSEMGFNEGFMTKLKDALPGSTTFEGKWVSSFDIDRLPRDVASELVQGVQRGAKQVIQGSFRGENFRAQTSMLGQILTQFRSFTFLSMEKQWGRVAGATGSVAATAYLAGQMMAAIPIHLARVQFNAMGKQDAQKYIDQNTSVAALVRASLNYASLAGLMGEGYDAVNGVVGAATGTKIGGENARTGAKNGFVSSIVPGLSYADGAVKNAMGLVSKPTFEQAAKLGKSVLPGGNIPYLAWAFNAGQ